MSKASKHNRILRALLVLVLLALLAFCTGCGSGSQQQEEKAAQTTEQTAATDAGNTGNVTPSSSEETVSTDPADSSGGIREDGVYDSRDDVTAYILAYDRLPGNYMTKKEARDLGWSGGSLERYAPGKCIGGDRFGNNERLLPKGEYRECDIDTLGKKERGPKRLVFSDEAIYYTDDHYRSFTKMADR